MFVHKKSLIPVFNTYFFDSTISIQNSKPAHTNAYDYLNQKSCLFCLFRNKSDTKIYVSYGRQIIFIWVSDVMLDSKKLFFSNTFNIIINLTFGLSNIKSKSKCKAKKYVYSVSKS